MTKIVKILVIFFLAVLGVGVLLTAVTYIRASNCKVQSVTCGLQPLTPGDTSRVYIAKINRFYNSDATTFVSLNFGSVGLDLPLGLHTMDQVLITPAEIDSGTNAPSEDIITLSEDSASNLTTNYSGHYVRILVPTVSKKDEALTRVNQLLANLALPESVHSKANRAKQFWSDCLPSLNRLNTVLKGNNILSIVLKKYSSIMDKNYTQCLPLTQFLEIINSD